jgi:hypothetical protein
MRDEDSPETGLQIRLEWGAVDPLDLVMVDQLSMTRVNRSVYLIFGQTRIPIIEDGEKIATAQIRPMARLVVSEDAFGQMMNLLGKAASDIGEGK